MIIYQTSFPQFKGKKPYFDLWEANKRQLLDLGVRKENIEISRICTYEAKDLFYSVRREGPSTGRFLTGILML